MSKSFTVARRNAPNTIQPSAENLFPTSDATQIQNAVSAFVARQQFTLLGESHTNSEENLRMTLANPDFMAGLEKGGVKHIIFELPVELQDAFNAYATSSIDKNALMLKVAQQWNSNDITPIIQQVGNMAALAKEHHIAIHCIDNNRFATYNSELTDKIINKLEHDSPGAKDRWNQFVKTIPAGETYENGDYLYSQRIRSFILAEFKEHYAAEYQAVLKIAADYRTNDLKFFNLIKQTIPAGERTIGYFGADHLTNHDGAERQGIDDRLTDGGYSVTTVGLRHFWEYEPDPMDYRLIPGQAFSFEQRLEGGQKAEPPMTKGSNNGKDKPVPNALGTDIKDLISFSVPKCPQGVPCDMESLAATIQATSPAKNTTRNFP